MPFVSLARIASTTISLNMSLSFDFRSHIASVVYPSRMKLQCMRAKSHVVLIRVGLSHQCEPTLLFFCEFLRVHFLIFNVRCLVQHFPNNFAYISFISITCFLWGENVVTRTSAITDPRLHQQPPHCFIPYFCLSACSLVRSSYCSVLSSCTVFYSSLLTCC